MNALKSVRNGFVALLLAIVASPAMAVGSLQATDFIGKVTDGWLFILITAGFGLIAVLEIFKRWQDIFEGNILKNIAVIGAWIAVTVYWTNIVKFVIS
jgi:hypothetical protein